jgi:hypothetical protein
LINTSKDDIKMADIVFTGGISISGGVSIHLLQVQEQLLFKVII